MIERVLSELLQLIKRLIKRIPTWVLMAIGITIFILLVVLAFVHKRILVELEIDTSRIGFSIAEDEPEELIRRVTTGNINIQGFEEFSLEVVKLSEVETGQVLVRNRMIRIVPTQGKYSSVKLEGEDGNLDLESMELLQRSNVIVSIPSERNIIIGIENKENKLSNNVNIDVDNPFRMEVRYGRILDERGGLIRDASRLPEMLQIIPQGNILLDIRDGKIKLLSIKDLEFIRKAVKVKGLAFYRLEGRRMVSTIIGTSYLRFPYIERERLNLNPYYFLLIPKSEEFYLERVNLGRRGLKVYLSGSTNRIFIGPHEDRLKNVTPTLRGWLYRKIISPLLKLFSR
jgi:hypothetical protein